MLCIPVVGLGQVPTTTPATQSAPAAWNPAQALTAINDFSFSYAQPGFYALLRHVKAHGIDATTPPLTNVKWTDLLERPADFRGRLVHLHGALGGNRRWKHESAAFADLGYLSEIQLTQADEPIICKVILTGDASDVPLGALVDVDAYFVTIQYYYSETKRQHQAAVFIGEGPTIVSTAAAHPSAPSSFDWIGPIVTTTVGLLIAYLILRRSVQRHRPIETLRAARGAPLHLADDLAAWANDPQAAQPDQSAPQSAETREKPPE